MTPEGYPDEQELERIKEWSHEDDFHELLMFVFDRWKYPDYRFYQVMADGSKRYELHTGGWSGNESLIDALHSNVFFWVTCWWKSERGGHYEFRN